MSDDVFWATALVVGGEGGEDSTMVNVGDCAFRISGEFACEVEVADAGRLF